MNKVIFNQNSVGLCIDFIVDDHMIGFHVSPDGSNLVDSLNSQSPVEDFEIEATNFDLTEFYICNCDSLVEHVRKNIFMKVIEGVS
ncbi:hypothetical protein [Prochlorococcus sp. ALOHA_ZT_50]|uniref:hypothetical protein n=1 Tax=Prochlorococcus sp. ALOHA_ZT_50 TaxID=2919303 RepID=UPI0025804465|nr:hypothetical protein [Prochlorococcus sp. ALOHA_ZT_50]MCH2079639.1 hypothetical protein [Prochlorococcus sp. ALOHA_ZT_50]